MSDDAPIHLGFDPKRELRLSDYPDALIEHLESHFLDPSEEIEAHGWTPETAPTNITPHWRKSASSSTAAM